MKALVLSAYKQLEIDDVPVPHPADDEVLIRIKACGICGSDVHGYDGSTGRRIPPIVMGHEAAGAVESKVTRSPTLKPHTFEPTAATTPAASCPITIGGIRRPVEPS